MDKTFASASLGARIQKRVSLFHDTSKLGWITVAYLLAVIAWGAYVRASGSGAGCGSHWPLCNGEVIPRSSNLKTWIEFTHRLTSGFSLVLCLSLFWSAFRSYPKGSFTRKGATATLCMIIFEALLGAGLVLLELVAENKSVFRTVSLGVHLLSTFILLAAVVLTAHWAKQESRSVLRFQGFGLNWKLALLSFLSITGILILGGSGAMTALGDTLFPSSPLQNGLSQDLSATSHFLIQLRIFHPIFAIGVTLYLLGFGFYLKKRHAGTDSEIPFFATALSGFQCAQVLLGAINILLLVPISIQLAHLFLADVVWIFLILTLSSLWVLPIGQFSSLESKK